MKPQAIISVQTSVKRQKKKNNPDFCRRLFSWQKLIKYACSLVTSWNTRKLKINKERKLTLPVLKQSKITSL